MPDAGQQHETGRTRSPAGRRAVLWMIVAVVCFIPLPLIIWAGTRDMSPFLFVAVWYAAGLPAQAVLRQMQRTGDTGAGSARLAIVSDLAAAKRRYLVASGVCRLGWFLYALAVTLVEPVVATVVIEFWPAIFAVVTLTNWWRDDMLPTPPEREAAGEHESGNKGVYQMLLLLFIGGAGVGFAVLSDVTPAGWSPTALAGLVLAVLATLGAALGAAFEQRMGKLQRVGHAAEASDVSASGGITAQAATAPLVVLIGIIVAAADGLSVWWSASGALLAMTAAAAQVAGNWCFVRANHLSREAHRAEGAQINSIGYLTPIGALPLLVLLADTTIERPDLLIIGAAGVVVVNMILHLDPEGAQQRASRVGGYGYRALILALWGAAAAVLLRDDWLPESWQVWSVVEYWALIGVLVTVFILVLSFRQSRLAERRREMDSLMLRLHQRLMFMAASGDLPSEDAKEVARLLRTIDTARKPQDLNMAYLNLRPLLAGRIDVSPRTSRPRAERLSETLADAEVLTNLRQQDRNFSEVAVLAMFAAVTVALTVAARPVGELTPFAGWAHDTASMTVAAAFTFLGFDLADKRREADAPLLRKVSPAALKNGQPEGWRLELAVWKSQTFERRASALLGAAMLIGAVVMLGFKWVG